MTNNDRDRDPDEERSEAGDEMSSRLASRFNDSDSEQPDSSMTSKPSKPSKTEESSKTSKPSKGDSSAESGETPVKDRPSVLMYLPESLHEDLDIRFDELNARYKRKHGEALEKNRDYYPAVVEAGLEGKDLEDVLEL